MLYPCICNVVISCWKSGAYDIVICRGGADMCFVPGSGWKHLDLEQYRISGLTWRSSRRSILPPAGCREEVFWCSRSWKRGGGGTEAGSRKRVLSSEVS